MFDYSFEPSALKKLSKLPLKLQQRIFTKLDYFCQQNPIAFATQLTNHEHGQYRFRIGDYRVIFDLDEEKKLLTILALGHRREIYK